MIFDFLRKDGKSKKKKGGRGMTYLISDIHGEYELFMKLLDQIAFSEADRMIVCGDMIEKGAESVRLLKKLFSMPNVECIMGNHEYDFFKFYRTRMHSAIMDYDAILWHLQQFFPEGEREQLDWPTVDRLVHLPFYIEEDRFICVHAGLPLGEGDIPLPIEDAEPEELVYDRRMAYPTVLPKGNKCIVFGHTPATSYEINGAPTMLCYLKQGRAPIGNETISDFYKIALDTGVSTTRVLGCFRVEDCKSFYVNK